MCWELVDTLAQMLHFRNKESFRLVSTCRLSANYKIKRRCCRRKQYLMLSIDDVSSNKICQDNQALILKRDLYLEIYTSGLHPKGLQRRAGLN